MGCGSSLPAKTIRKEPIQNTPDTLIKYDGAKGPHWTSDCTTTAPILMSKSGPGAVEPTSERQPHQHPHGNTRYSLTLSPHPPPSTAICALFAKAAERKSQEAALRTERPVPKKTEPSKPLASWLTWSWQQ